MAFSEAGSMRNRYWIQLGLLLLLVAVANGNTLWNDFVYDDYSQIVNNPRLTGFGNLPYFFTHDVMGADAGDASNYYRPMMYVMYLVTAGLFSGVKPWGFHLVNLLLHGGVAVLVFTLSSRLLERDGKAATPPAGLIPIPFLCAALFAVHPVHSEAVAWVACVPELAFTLFSLLALSFHLRSERTFDPPHLLALLFFSLGLLSKETAVVLVPMLVVADYLFRDGGATVRRALARYGTFVVVVAGYAVLRINALGGLVPRTRNRDLSTLDMVLNVPVLFRDYLGKLLVPVNLNAYYVFHPIRSAASGEFITAMVAVAAFGAAAVLAFRKNRTLFFGLVVVLLPLLPAFLLRGFGERVFSERYLYFPSFGYVLVIGSLLSLDLFRARPVRTAVLTVAGLVVAIFVAGTIQRNGVWRNDLLLWDDTVAKSPDGLIPLQHAGLAHYAEGDMPGAERYLAAACAREKAGVNALKVLAGIYLLTDRGDEALALLRRVEKESPGNPEILLMLGRACQAAGKGAEGEVYLNQARGKFPGFERFLADRVQALCTEGESLMTTQKIKEAEVRFREAYLMKPDFVPVLVDLGGVAATRGDTASALRFFSRAASLDPANPAPHYNLSLLFEMMGKKDDAAREMELFRRLDEGSRQRPKGPQSP